MIKKLFSFLVIFTFFLTLPGLVLAANGDLGSLSNKTVEVKKGEVVNHDLFAAGESVIISGTVNGDVYAAGANVLVDGIVNGDLLAAGATVTVLGNISDDVRAAGSSVIIKGPVGKNVVAFGSNVTLSSEGKVGGSFLAAGNTIDLSGPISKDVNAYGNQVLLTSTVGRDFQGMMQSLVLGSGAKIVGDLNYQSSQQANVPAGVVSGKVTYKPIEKTQPNLPPAAPFALAGLFVGLKFFLSFTGFLISLVVGLIYLSLLPKRAESLVNIIGSKPWVSLGVGLLTIIIFPLVLVILAVSLVGLPLLFLLVPLFLFFLYMAKIFTAFYLGRRILSSDKLLGPLLVGLLLYYVLSFIPGIGFLTVLAFVTVGLGAFILDLKSLRQPAR